MKLSIPQARQAIIDTPYGQALGSSFRWSGGQYCAIHTARGFIGCGIYDVKVAGEFGIVVAIAKGTPEEPLSEPEDLFQAEIVEASGPAIKLGIVPGMSGLEALQKLLACET